MELSSRDSNLSKGLKRGVFLLTCAFSPTRDGPNGPAQSNPRVSVTRRGQVQSTVCVPARNSRSVRVVQIFRHVLSQTMARRCCASSSASSRCRLTPILRRSGCAPWAARGPVTPFWNDRLSDGRDHRRNPSRRIVRRTNRGDRLAPERGGCPARSESDAPQPTLIKVLSKKSDDDPKNASRDLREWRSVSECDFLIHFWGTGQRSDEFADAVRNLEGFGDGGRIE